jgi:hypothetical protein
MESRNLAPLGLKPSSSRRVADSSFKESYLVKAFSNERFYLARYENLHIAAEAGNGNSSSQEESRGRRRLDCALTLEMGG